MAILGALIFMFFGVIFAVALARGYRVDFIKKEVVPTGILVATSDPDGAEVIINGKLTTATNSTLNLAPGTYQVKIHKEGYSVWEKKIEIKKEEVFKTNAFLFPSLPNLRPLTTSGATNPSLSWDKTKITYSVASASAQKIDGNGVWVLDMSRLPIISTADFRQIFRNNGLNLSKANFFWSQDNKQIIASQSGNLYALETDRLNENPLIAAKLPEIKENLNIFPYASYSAHIRFSPDETKVLYVATASATLPSSLIYLPGSNPTPEIRSLIPNKTYVYDLKENRNYLVDDCSWFPSSRHLLCIYNNQIAVTEYDGTNKAVVFNGQFDPKSVFVWPNWSKIVILTTLGSSTEDKNLYTINLR